jgi:thiol-disulfide isomerase/thioredoxin
MKYTLFLILALIFAQPAWAESPAGLWNATINFNGTAIPFKLEIAVENSKIAGAFLNGNDRETSTSGKFEQGSLILRFDDYAAELDATINDGVLEGLYGPLQKKYYSIQAKRHEEPAKAIADAPSIGGLWEIEGINNAKGESAWHLIVRQSNTSIFASILRVDGDTGEIAGAYKDGKFVLGHFSGARPALLVLTPQSDGTLAVKLTDANGSKQYSAFRPEQARAKGLPSPQDPNVQVEIKDPIEPFPFRFPDLSGRIFSNTDSRFRQKVLLVNISGSWCPNCHDAAPFLADVYRTYRSQGLEVVSLSFEEADQLKDPARLRAFIKKYGIEYPVLLAGEPTERAAKLPQQGDSPSWPTTLLIGRDGAVRFIRIGFPSAASGLLYQKAKDQFTAQVERLLSEGRELTRK